MSQIPNPTEADAPSRGQPENDEVVRNVFCPCYETCLDVVVRRNWRNWTCANCPLQQATGDKPTPAAFAHRRNRDDWV